jgi:hypothetical protein
VGVRRAQCSRFRSRGQSAAGTGNCVLSSHARSRRYRQPHFDNFPTTTRREMTLIMVGNLPKSRCAECRDAASSSDELRQRYRR